MAKKYQVVHMKNLSSMSTGEANEHQRRFTEKMWENRQNRRKNNIDRSRSELNFELLRGGKQVPLGSEKSIKQRIAERYKEAGIQDPNVERMERYKAKGEVYTGKPYRTICELILSGNADFMRNLAFGDQKVDMTKGADNSHLVLHPEIIKWAKDVYKALAKRYGEENIVSFVVHVDESSPHIHCCILPIYYDENKGRNRVMYRDTFGGEATVLDELHDYMAEVNAKWGLEHGEPVSVTGNRHIPREEYYAMLGHEIQEREEKKSKLESAIKGLGTMIEHLTTERDGCTAEIEELEELLAQCQGDKSEIEAKIEALKARVSDLDARLADKRTKLMEADRKLKEAKTRVREAITNFENMEKANAIVQEKLGKDVDSLFKTTFFDDAVEDVKTMLSNNPDLKLGDKAEVLKAMFHAGAEHMVDVVDKAKELFLAGINGAANVQASGGGGGSTSDMPWRDKDEDLAKYLLRCLQAAGRQVRAKYAKPKYKPRRS